MNELKNIAEFNHEVIERLGYYVYRLVDPKDGKTFYVGKGSGNRIFAHLRNGKADPNAVMPARLDKIAQIRKAGGEVIAIIHRHGMTENEALHVEAALIDLFTSLGDPLTNIVKGHHSNEVGPASAAEIQHKYGALTATWQHKMLLVSVNRTTNLTFDDWGNGLTYDAARFAWKVGQQRSKVEYVLAVRNRVIIDAFRPLEWLPATIENFPDHKDASNARLSGFVGEPANASIWALYGGKRLPDDCNLSQQGFCYVG